MSRRPLLPLLALAALLALLPACRALSCYSCSDLSDSGVQGDHQHVVSAATKLPCSKFDSSNSSYRMDPCVAPYTASCVTLEYDDGRKIRGCFDEVRNNCTIGDKLTKCVCTSNYCNSAGLTTPALLLLLPAALLAALYSRQ